MDDMPFPKTHNQAPREVQVRDGIMERHHHLPSRNAELLDQAAKIPEVIPEEIADRCADFLKSITAQLKALEGARISEKEEFLAGSRIVDGVFKNMSDPLKKAKEDIERRLGVVRAARAERERKVAEEKARVEREAAEARRRAAEEEAERQRTAAAEARRLADEAEQAAREAAAQRQREAEEARRREREAADRAEREREEEAAKQAEARRRQDEELAAARERRRVAEEAAAEAGRKRDEEVQAAIKAEREAKKRQAEAEEQAERNRRDAERRRREEEAEAEESRKVAERAAREAERDANRRAEEQARVERLAGRAESRVEKDVAEAAQREYAAVVKETAVENTSSAKFGKIVGEYGGTLSARDHWTYANVDRGTLDLEALRQHLRQEDLERAVASFVRAGGRSIKGADIYVDTSNVSR